MRKDTALMMNDLLSLEIPTWRPIQQKGRLEVNEENVDKVLQVIKKFLLEDNYVDVFIRRYDDSMVLEFEMKRWARQWAKF